MKAAATHNTHQEAESHRSSFIQRSVDPLFSEEEETPFVSAKRLGIQPKLKSSSDKFIQRQEETIGNILSWGKRWFANGIVINYSSRRVRVWSSDAGLYWIEPGQRSAISGEDVDHVQDHSGQWYKIGFNYVTVDRHGNVLGAQCRASGPGLDCSSTATTPERSDLDIDRPSSVGVQTKLIVGAPDDPYEQEADAMAEHVMRMPLQPEEAPVISRINSGKNLQRMCSECEEEMQVQRMCDDCEEETAVQRSESSGGEAHASSHILNRLQSRQGQGSPLPISVQTQMGQSFGTDFSNVRIHTDTEAAQMSQDLNAQAFTHGSDIYFNQGKYDTGSSGGQRLLAHELTHTVQQRDSSSRPKIQARRIRQNYSTAAYETGPLWNVFLVITGAPQRDTGQLQEFIQACQRGIRDAARDLEGNESGIIRVNIRYRSASFFSDVSQESYRLAMQSVLGTVEEEITSLDPVNQEPEIPPAVETPEASAPTASSVCGPDVTVAIRGVLNTLDTYFQSLDLAGKRVHCYTLHNPLQGFSTWDIFELYCGNAGWIDVLTHAGVCATPGDDHADPCSEPADSCRHSVRMAGQCILAGTLNYMIWGQMHRLCHQHAATPENLGTGLIHNPSPLPMLLLPLGSEQFNSDQMTFFINLYKGFGLVEDPRAPIAMAQAAFLAGAYAHPPVANRAHCVGVCPYNPPRRFSWTWRPGHVMSP